MRAILALLFSLLFVLSAFGQITHKNNCIRSGDEIIKQQVEYKDPGRAGENVLWDFSKLKPINPEYHLVYSSPYAINDSLYVMGKDTISVQEVAAEDLIIGTEHYTQYFYRVKDGKLLLLGHKNPVTSMHHQTPVEVLEFPFSYGQKSESKYVSQSVYSGMDKMNISGDISIQSDAKGMMILPSKDTLYHVTRVKTTRTIVEDIDSFEAKYKYLPDSVRQAMNPKPLNSRIETYSWYEQGYRYPIFETIENFNVSDTTETLYFSTAFFYPPQEHYYLEEDPENLAVLDSLANETTPEPNPNGYSQWLLDNFTYNYGPNPVKTILDIEYHLEEAAEVGITLHSSTGLIKSIPIAMKSEGLYTESINMSGLYPGTYILRFLVRDEVVSNVIIKK